CPALRPVPPSAAPVVMGSPPSVPCPASPAAAGSSCCEDRPMLCTLPGCWFVRPTPSPAASPFVSGLLFQGNPQYLGEFFLRLDNRFRLFQLAAQAGILPPQSTDLFGLSIAFRPSFARCQSCQLSCLLLPSPSRQVG